MKLSYILITPAYNEEQFIEKTIQSTISQTVLPKIWIIVSDGSTDNTNEIIQKYAKNRDWIKFIQNPKKKERNFAAKVEAFNVGYNMLNDIKFDIIGNLDGDISFNNDYFEYILGKFEQDPRLGVAGTDYTENNFHSNKDSYINVHHVNGQCQLFQKRCFEDIGGYTPMKEGGIDWVAVTTARMKGWNTRSFPDRTFYHHRSAGTANGNIYLARYKYGKKDYFLGGHPLWQICRGMFQMSKKPYFFGGFLLLTGYFWSMIKRVKRPISKELKDFIRTEQMARLKLLIFNKFNRKGLNNTTVLKLNH